MTEQFQLACAQKRFWLLVLMQVDFETFGLCSTHYLVVAMI